jgi:hypothetical protein
VISVSSLWLNSGYIPAIAMIKAPL